MAYHSLKRKILAASLGVVSCFLLLELGLFLLENARKDAPLRAANGGEFTVLCLGNSYTAGIGAGPSESYPKLLEDLIRERHSYLRPRVVNAGTGNATTTLLLEKLPNLLDRDRPQVVAIMAGEPNLWNDYGFAKFLLKRDPTDLRIKLKVKLADFMNRFRSLRWIRLAIFGFQEQPVSAAYRSAAEWIGILEPKYYRTEIWSEDMLATLAWKAIHDEYLAKPEDPYLARVMAKLAMGIGRYKEAIGFTRDALKKSGGKFLLDIYRKASRELDRVKLSPDDRRDVNVILGMVDAGRIPKALLEDAMGFAYDNDIWNMPKGASKLRGRAKCDYTKRLLEWIPLDFYRHTVLADCLIELDLREEAASEIIAAARRNPLSNYRTAGVLARYQEKFGDKSAAGRMLAAAIEAHRKQFYLGDPRFSFQRPPNHFRSIEEWILSDMKEMTSLVRAKGSAVLVQGYPPLRNNEPRDLEKLLREFARRERLPYSDTSAAFEPYFADWKRKEALYTTAYGKTDPHMSGKGNIVIAEALYATLLEAGLIPPRAE